MGGYPPKNMKGHMKEIEIEKKFLLTQDKAKELIIGVEPIDMIDYYVPNGQPHMQLRLRKNGDKYCITRKIPLETGVMSEQTLDINKTEFEYLITGIQTSVAKDRYKTKWHGLNVEVDIYKGRHEGLNVLEIEFSNKEMFNNFQDKLEGCTDITGIEKYAAGKLAEV